jgi:hypothetical protein
MHLALAAVKRLFLLHLLTLAILVQAIVDAVVKVGVE